MTRIRRGILLAAFLIVIPAIALAQDAFTTRTSNVRAGPDRSYPVVAQLPPGAALQVMGCIDGYSWCDVVFADIRGWIYAGSLVYPYQNQRVPLLSYGATIGVPIITFSIGNYWDNYYRGRPFYRNRSYWVSRPPPHFRPPPHSNRPQPRPAPPSRLPRGQNESRPKDHPPPVNNNRPPGGRPEATRQNNPPRATQAPHGGSREPRGNGGNAPPRKDSQG